MPVVPTKEPLAKNRRAAVLNAGASIFSKKGKDAATMRDISQAAGMRQSSLYYFFESKESLFEAVYVEGVRRILLVVKERVQKETTPWARLEQLAIGHLEALLNVEDFAAVVAQTVPNRKLSFDQQLAKHRDEYEVFVKVLIDELNLPKAISKTYFRLNFLSALNGVLNWYRPGMDTPLVIAQELVKLFRLQLESNPGKENFANKKAN